MGSCICKDKSSANAESSNSSQGRSRRMSEDGLHPTESVVDGASSSSSGYHGSQALMGRRSLVKNLVLETLSVIRTLIDK